MATNIQIFNNPEFGDVRTIIKEDGTLLFVASDVAKSLGYAVPQKAVIDHCKHCSKMEHPSNKGTYINLIPESDLYRLTMKSKLPLAEKFQDWVCEEVIPSIRKTGSYSVQPKTPQTYLEALEALVEAEKEKQRLETENKANTETIRQQAPKVQYYDNTLQAAHTYTSTQMAKELNMRTAEQLHKALKEKGIMFYQSGQWMLTAKYSEKGYTKPRTTVFTRSDGSQGTNTITVWTEKGREFLHKTFGT